MKRSELKQIIREVIEESVNLIEESKYNGIFESQKNAAEFRGIGEYYQQIVDQIDNFDHILELNPTGWIPELVTKFNQGNGWMNPMTGNENSNVKSYITVPVKKEKLQELGVPEKYQDEIFVTITIDRNQYEYGVTFAGQLGKDLGIKTGHRAKYNYINSGLKTAELQMTPSKIMKEISETLEPFLAKSNSLSKINIDELVEPFVIKRMSNDSDNPDSHNEQFYVERRIGDFIKKEYNLKELTGEYETKIEKSVSKFWALHKKKWFEKYAYTKPSSSGSGVSMNNGSQFSRLQAAGGLGLRREA